MDKQLRTAIHNYTSLVANAQYHVNKLIDLTTSLVRNLVDNFNAKMIRLNDVAKNLGFEYVIPIFDPNTKKCISFKVVLEGGEYRTLLPSELSPLALERITYELIAVNNCMEDGIEEKRVQVYAPNEERKQI